MKINGEEIEFVIKKSRRARRMRMSISCGGGVIVTVPRYLSVGIAEKFIKEKSAWIIKKIEFIRKNSFHLPFVEDYKESKFKAHSFAKERLEYYNRFYNFKYNRIFIKNHKNRWGSCSSNRNLNFNYRILFLPQELADYIIVHELCHLKEMNHSRNFWQLVEKIFPEHKAHRRELRKILF